MFLPILAAGQRIDFNVTLVETVLQRCPVKGMTLLEASLLYSGGLVLRFVRLHLKTRFDGEEQQLFVYYFSHV